MKGRGAARDDQTVVALVPGGRAIAVAGAGTEAERGSHCGRTAVNALGVVVRGGKRRIAGTRRGDLESSDGGCCRYRQRFTKEWQVQRAEHSSPGRSNGGELWDLAAGRSEECCSKEGGFVEAGWRFWGDAAARSTGPAGRATSS